ncbi:uracil-DNA glycosylase [Desulfoluna butyratoxydans]|uniref:Type-4 uracil-DNA glycosylase n=1 Tax=Desulfoluna butyratoxydans TaxID=231438 RepID=A0A4V6IM17_9BACT|nr:uracil-DNA glycosylase [Desulfoluna butyratoxydans]VFQ47308.1 uracil-dna glycosylase-like [Desulfoluna butyratoxydans]
MMENNPRTHQHRAPLEEIKATLLYLKSLGLKGVECTEDASKLLRTMGRPAAGPVKRVGAPVSSGRGQASVNRAQVAQPRREPSSAAPQPVSGVSRAGGPFSNGTDSVSPKGSGPGVHRSVAEPVVDTLETIRRDMGECTRCSLFRGRTNIVFGAGNPQARLMFIGDMPLAEEDRQGTPFLGASGELINNMIKAMGLRREDVYLSNLLKCCPAPGQGRPDASFCLSFLERQIAVVRPDVICALGAVAAQALLGITSGVAEIRGQFQNYKGIRLMPTFHPTFLLRHPERKRQAWQDLQQVMAVLKAGDRR